MITEMLKRHSFAAGAVGDNVFSVLPGQMTMMNAQVSYNAPFSKRLTDYAVGVKMGGGLKELREFLAPTVNVGTRKFDFLEIDNAEKLKFVTRDEAIRARGGEFRSLTIAGHTRTDSLENYGFSSPVEYADLEEDPNLDREVVDMLTEATDTVELLWAWEVLDALAIEKEISLAENPDLDSALKLELQKNYDESGIAVNRVFFGGGAWAKREYAYRNASLHPGTLNYAKTAQQAGSDLGVNLMVGDARVITSTGAMPLLKSNEILAFFAVAGATRYDATNVKFFAANGLNGRSSEVYQSTSYQGTIKHTTLSRWGAPRVGNGFGVVKFKLVD